jgi:hypothetical protein
MVNKLYERKPISTGLAVSPKIRRENEIKEDLGFIEINN